MVVRKQWVLGHRQLWGNAAMAAVEAAAGPSRCHNPPNVGAPISVKPRAGHPATGHPSLPPCRAAALPYHPAICRFWLPLRGDILTCRDSI